MSRSHPCYMLYSLESLVLYQRAVFKEDRYGDDLPAHINRLGHYTKINER